MNEYVLNRQSNVLHRLPASESCNTDQIANRKHMEFDAEVDPREFRSDGKQVAYCRRCFK